MDEKAFKVDALFGLRAGPKMYQLAHLVSPNETGRGDILTLLGGLAFALHERGQDSDEEIDKFITLFNASFREFVEHYRLTTKEMLQDTPGLTRDVLMKSLTSSLRF